MNSEKIIFLDIDGTLIDYTQKMPPSTLEALRLAQARGHKLLIATGRSKHSIYPYLLDLGFDGIIAGDGAYVEFSGEVLQRKYIPEEQIKRLHTYLEDKKIGFFEECDSGLYGNRYYVSESARIFNLSMEASAERVKRVFPELSLDHTDYHLDVNKVSFVMSPSVDADELQREFGDFFRLGVWNVFGKERIFGDFTQKDVNKGTAAAFLLNALDRDREDSFAFGDAYNDIEILQYCQTGVAMGNADDEVKAVADYVTSDIKENGIFNAFEYFGLI